MNSQRPKRVPSTKKSGISPKMILIFSVASVLFILVAVLVILLPPLFSEDSSDTPPTTSEDFAETSGDITEELPPLVVSEVDELRGIYIASVMNINFPSAPALSAEELRAELDDIVSTCRAANLNAIFFQVRPSADSLYDSDIFPTSYYLTGEQGAPLTEGFDPLDYLIEKAHGMGIRVHAWVNPFRVTVGSPSKPQHDVNALAENHPARLNPSYVVPYADGRLYFDCGIPEVRTLIADGVYEIASKYDVDSIIFDDYFYPYPKYADDGSLEKFSDDESYEKYGGELSLEDWRRENVNSTILACYNAVKGANPDCEFGVAPFGIWQNDDGENGGSDTSGLESYSAIYCDPTAWIDGGYIDYIAPQIYWKFNDKNARYDVLVRWWNKILDGSDVELLVSHGAYNYDSWDEPENQMRCQIEFARGQLAYKGSILYGYAALKANSHGLFDEISDVFSESITYPEITSNSRNLIISIPYSGSYIDGEGTFVIGTSDPTELLTVDGKTVGRTKSGYFSLYLPLEEGKNTFTFSHKGQEREYIIHRGTAPSSTTVTYPTLDSPGISSVTPEMEWVGSGTLPVSVTAPRGSSVKATLGDKTITLTPTLYVPYTGGYMKEIFTGSFALSAKEGEIIDMGTVKFSTRFSGKTYSAESAKIRALGDNACIPIEVINNDSEMKIAYDSWYYDDYTPQSAGMRDNAVGLANGMYKLRCGGLISAENVRELDLTEIPTAKVSKAFVETDTDFTYFKVQLNENIPVNCYIEDGEFCVTLYNIDTDSAKKAVLPKNPMFKSVRGEKSARAGSYKYFFELYATENFYGFDHYYKDGYLVIRLRNPKSLPDTDKPLLGKTIILDAGHGGRNPGALGPLGSAEGAINESDFNLKIVLEAEKYLENLGATVVQIRDESCEIDVPIPSRLETLIDTSPDLVISVHQNSMPYTTDVTKIHGCVGLYWADSGYMLTEAVGEAISTALNKANRSPTKQRLAMVRNNKFPATLVETCFITNVEEYERMMKPDTVPTIAKAIADGVLNFYKAQAKYILP